MVCSFAGARAERTKSGNSGGAKSSRHGRSFGCRTNWRTAKFPHSRSFVCSLACSPASIAFLVGIRVLAQCVRVYVCDLLPPARPRTISKRHMCSPETSHVHASSCFTRRLRSLEIQHLKREVHSSTFKSSSCNHRVVDQKTLVYLKFLSNSTVHLFLMTSGAKKRIIKNFSLLKTIS